MGSGEILGHINEFLSSINKYFNPIGKFYIQVQVLCRVLVCSVFLDDLFKSSSLECETKQVGCQQNCINRFAPLNHKKIWELELFTVMLAIVVFLAFSLYNDYTVNKLKKKRDRLHESDETKEAWLQNAYSKRSMVRKTKKKQEFFKSPITTAGYITMLLFRLTFEIIFLFIENQLGKHQSQNTEFWNSFWLKESWLCATNTPKAPMEESLDRVLPESNRSEIFWTDDWNMACLQQQITVTCWIPFSRMKSFGLLFMYWVLLVTTFLTFCELIFEIVKLCKSCGNNNSGSTISNKPLINQQQPQFHEIIASPDYNTQQTLQKDEQVIVKQAGEDIVKVYPELPASENQS